MKKEFLLLSIPSIVILMLVCILIFVPAKKPVQLADIQINLQENQKISSPLEITGTVNGNGWVGFEGQVGTVKLLDSNGNQIALGILTAITDWMKLPTEFKTTLEFDAAPGSAILLFRNENPSGDPARDKTFILPVKLKTSGETSIVKLYFIKDRGSNIDIDCEPNNFVSRTIPKTQAIAKAALEELFKGPTESEINNGFDTVINTGVKVNSLIIDDNGIAYADFSQELESTGGSCMVTAIRAEITKTLKQFPTVKNVVISINGRTEDILQP